MKISIIGAKEFELELDGNRLWSGGFVREEEEGLIRQAAEHLIEHDLFINKIIVNGCPPDNINYVENDDYIELEVCGIYAITARNFRSAQDWLGSLLPYFGHLSRIIGSGDLEGHQLLIRNIVPILRELKTLQSTQPHKKIQEVKQEIQNAILSAQYSNLEPLEQYFHVGFPEEGCDLKSMVADFENKLIIEAMEKTNWTEDKAADLLGLNQTVLIEKLKENRSINWKTLEKNLIRLRMGEGTIAIIRNRIFARGELKSDTNLLDLEWKNIKYDLTKFFPYRDKNQELIAKIKNRFFEEGAGKVEGFGAFLVHELSQYIYKRRESYRIYRWGSSSSSYDAYDKWRDDSKP